VIRSISAKSSDDSVQPVARTFCSTWSGVVAPAEEAHLALPHQIIERAQGFLDRGLRVRAMQLVKVDPIGAQPLQARLDRVHDVAP